MGENMPQGLSNARRQLSRAPSDVKQGQVLTAATAVRDAARLFGRVAMMKAEQEELSDMLRNGADALYYCKDVTRIFPLAIVYKPGEEAGLVDLMNQLIESLEEAGTADAVSKHQAYQNLQLSQATAELGSGSIEQARSTLEGLREEFPDDGDLAAQVGDVYMQAGLFEDSARHYSDSARLLPQSPHVLNKLGISLRKTKHFEEAETYFARAVDLEKNDPNLYFNLGRLYLDWQQWSKAALCARKAQELNPQFGEAGKMAVYAEKMAAKA